MAGLTTTFAPDRVGQWAASVREERDIWRSVSTWGLLLLLLYFALAGVSPFVNEPTATRAVATVSAGGVVFDRLSKLLICVACLMFAMQRQKAVLKLGMRMKLIISSRHRTK